MMEWNNSVVAIECASTIIDLNKPYDFTNTQLSSGTGFFIESNLILTCYHVIKNAVKIEISFKQEIKMIGTLYKIFPDDD